MYDHLLGEIVEKHTSRVVVRCAGVGYDVRVSLNSAIDLQVGSTKKLFTVLNVVDGMPSLLGFSTQAERELARRLLGVTNAFARERSEVPVRNPGFFTCRELPARHDDG